LFKLKEHLRMLGTSGTVRKINEKAQEKKQERNEARLRDA
jgi:RNase P/RNase MRP subunit POP5